MPPTTSSASSTIYDANNTKDNFIPLFSGQPSNYKEWRNAVLKILDGAFQYDDRVQLPSDFEAYFVKFHRQSGQTLLAYCTEHEELIKRLDRRKVTLPATVQGWLLLRRAGLTKEQRQLVTTQAPLLEKRKVQETLYLLFGQDYKEMAGRSDDRRWHRLGKGRGYAAHDDGADDDGGFDEDEYDESIYYGGDDWGEMPDDDVSFYDNDDFDAEAGYYHGDDTEDPVPFDVADYDEAFAAYTDARRRFNELKLSRGYLPIVALSDPSAGNLTPGLASPLHQQLPQVKGKKGGFGKGKGKGKQKGKGSGSSNVYRYSRGPGKERDPRGRASAAMRTCLRCGQSGHTTSECPMPRSSGNSPTKRPATSQSVESMAVGLETGMATFQDVNGHERVDCTMLDPGASQLSWVASDLYVATWST